MKIWEKGVGCFEKNVVNNGFNFVFWGVGWILRLVIFEVLVVKILVEKKSKKNFNLKRVFFRVEWDTGGISRGSPEDLFFRKKVSKFWCFLGVLAQKDATGRFWKVAPKGPFFIFGRRFFSLP